MCCAPPQHPGGTRGGPAPSGGGWGPPSRRTPDARSSRCRAGTGDLTHITQWRPLASSSRQQRRARAIRSVWCTAPTALCKAKALPAPAPRGWGSPGCARTPTYLGCTAVGHHVHLGDKLWELQCRCKDRQRTRCFGEPARSPPAADPQGCLTPAKAKPTAAQDFRHRSGRDAGGLVQLPKIFWKCGRRHKPPAKPGVEGSHGATAYGRGKLP